MDIQKKLQKFSQGLSFCALRDSEKQNYLEIERKILESKQLSDKQLLARAKKIKPLIRLRYDSDEEYKAKYCSFDEADILCFCTPTDIRRRSYIFDFTPKKIVKFAGKPMAVPKANNIGEFTCYHDTGTFYGDLMPSVDEVLEQIPQEFDWLQIDAFELEFASDKFLEVYDCVLDRHVSTVHLYRFENGLPAKLKGQTVIFEGKRY